MAGDTPITFQPGPAKPPPGYSVQPPTSPAMPGAAGMFPQAVQGMQSFNAPPPPVLGGLAQVGQPMAPQGGQVNPAMGQPNMGSPTPPTYPQQGAQGGTGDPFQDTLANDPIAAAEDARFNQFLDNELSITQQQGHQEGMNFINTLKAAKQRDPGGFYLMLSAFASGDPQQVTQMALYLRSQSEARQREARANVVGYEERRAAGRERAVLRQDTRDFQRDERQQRELDRARDGWQKAGVLDKIEAKLGPIDTYDKLAAARTEASKVANDRRVTDDFAKYLTALSKGPAAASDSVTQAIKSHPEWSTMVEKTKRDRDDLKALKDKNLQLRNQHLTRVNAVLNNNQIPWGQKQVVIGARRDYDKAVTEQEKWQQRVIDNSAKAALYGGAEAEAQIDREAELEAATQRADDALDAYNMALASVGASAMPSLHGATTNGDNEGGDEEYIDEGESEEGEAPPPPPTKRTRGRATSALDEFLNSTGGK